MVKTRGTTVKVVVAAVAGRGASLRRYSLFSQVQRILPAVILNGFALIVTATA
jgi:hypothetical protein